MMKFLTIGFLLLAATANAQPRPGAFTTLSTTGTITDGGILAVTGFGISTFNASGTGPQTVTIRNLAAGGVNRAVFNVGNDVSSTLTTLEAHSSTYAPVAYRLPNASLLLGVGANGLSIAADNPTGAIRFYTGAGSALEAMRILPSTGVTIGGTTDYGAKSLLVDGGGTISLTGSTFANLGSFGSTADGTMQWCSNCTPASSPCTGAGSGSMAFRQNGAWKCF